MISFMIQRISKKEAEALGKKLAYKPRLVWDAIKPQEEQKLWELGEDYKTFLDASKTERETVSEISRLLRGGASIRLRGTGREAAFIRPSKKRSWPWPFWGKNP